MTDLGRYTDSYVDYLGKIFLSTAAVNRNMSRSLPHPSGPPMTDKPETSQSSVAAYPYLSTPGDADRRVPTLPAPHEHHGRRRTSPSFSTDNNTAQWPSRSIPIPRMSDTSGYGHHARSSSSLDRTSAHPARMSPELRNILSFHDHSRQSRQQPKSTPEMWGLPGREPLPSISHLIPSEAPSGASNRSPLGPPWGVHSPNSPGTSSLAAVGTYEHVKAQPSPDSGRASNTHPNVYAPAVGHERRPQLSLSRTSTLIDSLPLQRGVSEVGYQNSYHNQRDTGADQVQVTPAASLTRWPHRSASATSGGQTTSYLKNAVDPTARAAPSPSSHISPQIDPQYSGDAIGSSTSTGPHSLPRFLCKRFVPDKGVCYFYDDGSHCKAVIDGEAVTALWGVTKAGKPRKRLAVACLTCREKKIKCDPDDPKCVQCDKFGRVCKFQHAPRGTRTSPDIVALEESDAGMASVSATPMKDQPVYTPDRPRSQREGRPERPVMGESRKRRSSCDLHRHYDSISDVDPLDYAKPGHYGPKRARADGDCDSHSSRGRPAPTDAERSPTRASFSNDFFSAGLLDPPSPFNWQTDPMEINSELVTHLAKCYFTHVNETTVHMFPRRPFLHWLHTCRDKSPDDRMLVYSLLTLAANFSPRPDRKSFSTTLADVARYAVYKRSASTTLQLAQSRLLLSLHYFALNKSVEALELGASAAQTAKRLKLNLEGDQSSRTDEDWSGFYQSAECRRRTFWAIYLRDRYDGFYATQSSTLNSSTIFLQLPCLEEDFETGTQAERLTPTRQEHALAMSSSSHGADHRPLGLMAYLVEITSIWGDVYEENLHAVYRPAHVYALNYARFYEGIQQRLGLWYRSLPTKFAPTVENLSGPIPLQTLRSLLSIYALYHATGMELNRRVISTRIDRDDIERNLLSAHRQASDFMQTMHFLMSEAGTPRCESLNPFIGYVIIMACDILSAKCSRREIDSVVTLLEAALSMLDVLKLGWATARVQKAQLSRRLEELVACLHTSSPCASTMSIGTDEIFVMSQPLTSRGSAVEADLLYVVGLDTYRRALDGDRKESGASTTGMISGMSIAPN